MNLEERNRLEEECLHFLWDCHEAPEEFSARLESDPELAALMQATRAKADLLTQAASAPAPKLDLRAPHTEPSPAPVFRPRFFGRGMRIAASVIFALFVLTPCAVWGWNSLKVSRLEQNSLRLVVSAPRGVPDGTPASVHVDTWDLAGDSLAAQVDWEAFDADGRSLAQGTQESHGSFDLSVPANLPGLREVRVTATHAGIERHAQVELAPNSEAPLAHLTTDKPIYRPGETVYARVVLLDRLSLGPIEGNCRVQIIDSKGSPVQSYVPHLEHGTGSFTWNIPESARGGEYRFELRDSKDEFAAESLQFVVRRFTPPTLAKKIELDRETYAPGESGRAEVFVQRVTGGTLRGAEVVGTLIVDGEEAWSETRTLDGGGAAQFEFSIPSVVPRGEGRFTCRINDGSVVETAIETFVIPTGKLEVEFYPEGGDLVAGVTNRVYAEVTDTLGRPTSGRGQIVNRKGERVTDFQTSHQGRARFEFVPEFGMRYSLRLADHDSEEFKLPESFRDGVAIRSLADHSPAGEPLRFAIETTGDGPFVAGLFCRGVLVAQDTFQGRGEHDLRFDLRDEIAGVLRLTIFDRRLTPLAERLTARASGRAISITVNAQEELLSPGDHQKLTLEARDEQGNPVACALGVTVTDRAVRDMAGDVRIGLADQTWLFADVEELEDVSEFLATDDESRRNVDLLLGTRGWRRFAWFDAETLLKEEGDRAKRLLVREGRPQVPLVLDEAGEAPTLVASARSSRREWKRASGGLSTMGGVLLIMMLLWSGVRMLPGLRTRRMLGHVAGFGACAFLALGSSFLFMQSPMMVADAQRVAMFEGDEVMMMAPEAEIAMPVEATGVEMNGFGPGQAGIALGMEVRFNADRQAIRGEAALAFPPAMQEPGKFAGLIDHLALADEPVGWQLDEKAKWDGGAFAEGRGRDAGRRFQQLVRVYAHRNGKASDAPRTDFTETVYWNPLIMTALDGRAAVEFDLSDRVTTWDVNIDAHGSSRVGQAHDSFRAVPPFHLDATLPVEITDGDEFLIPIAFNVRDESSGEALVVCSPRGSLQLTGEAQHAVALKNGLGRTLIPVKAVGSEQATELAIAGSVSGWLDSVRRPVRVVPRGFPVRLAQSGIANGQNEFSVAMPETWIDGSLEVDLVFYPSPLSELVEGMEGLLREPGGCFEQASRSNYPNVLALGYMEAVGDEIVSVSARSRNLLEKGYDLLTGYECSDLGYEWFGGSPGHEALTAYGLLQFHDMANVYDVESAMVDRTRDWLLARRDGKGGYLANSKALDSFGRAPAATTNAYCTYSLVVTGTPVASLERELDRLATRAVESEDAYELALCAAALEKAGRKLPAGAARTRLKTMQKEDGSLVGADTITRSGGDDLAVETTSLAILAWLADPADQANVRRALEFVVSKRQGHGTFGTTQATILALKALTAYAQSNRREVRSGDIAVYVNDYQVDTVTLDSGQVEAIRLSDFGKFLTAGPNRVRLLTSGGNEIPWSLDVRYTSEQPADSSESRVAIRTSLARGEVVEGETVSMKIEAENLTDEGQPMTMAIVGLPAGLEAPTEILDDLKKAGRFDFWELDGRQVILYWRALEPGVTKEVNLDLIARIPGTTTGPASHIRLYYTPQDERWSEPLRIVVKPLE